MKRGSSVEPWNVYYNEGSQSVWPPPLVQCYKTTGHPRPHILGAQSDSFLSSLQIPRIHCGCKHLSRKHIIMTSMFYSASILYIYAFYSVETGTLPSDEAQMLTVMSQQVDDIWNTILIGIPIKNNPDNNTYGICNLQPNPKLNASEAKITGQVLFRQPYPNGKLEAHFNMEGFPLNHSESTRAVHIHNFGDLSNGCDSTGGHYNPFSVNHPQHPGDFGNFIVQDGKIQQRLTHLHATLFGPYSVFGKSIVVHKMADDLGKGDNQASLENGNAGTRLACCVIGSSSKTSWDKFTTSTKDS